MNVEILNQGKTVSFDQILKVLTGSRVKELDAVFSGEDPEAICMKVVTASGKVKFLQFGSDNYGFTDLTEEQLKDNPFYMMVADPPPARIEDLTLKELKEFRVKCAFEAMKLKSQEAQLRKKEMDLVNAAPVSDALQFYFKVYMRMVNIVNQIINEREEMKDNGQM